MCRLMERENGKERHFHVWDLILSEKMACELREIIRGSVKVESSKREGEESVGGGRDGVVLGESDAVWSKWGWVVRV